MPRTTTAGKTILQGMLSVREAFLLPLQSPASRRDVFIGGLWLLVPFVGWLMNMGHRIVVTHAMLHDQPPWPAWRNHGQLLWHGSVTFAGMLFYYLPSVLLALAAWHGHSLLRRGRRPTPAVACGCRSKCSGDGSFTGRQAGRSAVACWKCFSPPSLRNSQSPIMHGEVKYGICSHEQAGAFSHAFFNHLLGLANTVQKGLTRASQARITVCVPERASTCTGTKKAWPCVNTAKPGSPTVSACFPSAEPLGHLDTLISAA